MGLHLASPLPSSQVSTSRAENRSLGFSCAKPYWVEAVGCRRGGGAVFLWRHDLRPLRQVLVD